MGYNDFSISALGEVEPINFSECVTVELNYEKVIEVVTNEVEKFSEIFCAAFNESTNTGEFIKTPLCAGYKNDYLYFTAGIVDLNAICNYFNLTVSDIIELNFEFTGDRNSEFDIWVNEGSVLIGRYYSLGHTYTVPFKEILEKGYKDFSISLTLTGGFVNFDDKVTVKVKKKGIIKSHYPNEWFDVSYKAFNTGNPDYYKCDIKLPEVIQTGQKAPVVLAIHGGDWIKGNKEYYGKEDYVNYKNNYRDIINSCGCIFVTINYTLAENSEADYKAPYPMDNMLSDIQSALNFLADNFSDVIDASKAALLGWSAGAQLALLYAYKSTRTDNLKIHSPIPIKLVISEAGPTDLNYNPEGIYSIFEPLFKIICGANDDNYEDRLKLYSPIEYVNSNVPETVLAYGTNLDTFDKNKFPDAVSIPNAGDGVVLFKMAEDLNEKLLQNHVPVTLIPLFNLNHNYFSWGDLETVEEYRQKIKEILQKFNAGGE